MNIIDEYRKLPYEKRQSWSLRFVIAFNLAFAVGKLALAPFFGAILVVSAVFNLLVIASKTQCFIGMMGGGKSLRFQNALVGSFLSLAGIQYSAFMAASSFFPRTSQYDLNGAIPWLWFPSSR
ncbi:MAG: hypothetical protein LKG11_01290 [Bacilli bacterium]|jgi:hypothetical protein|nr:hypothetical protein [Bacilli bacterium]